MSSPTGTDDTTHSSDRVAIAKFLMDTGEILRLFVRYREVLLPRYMQEPYLSAWPYVESSLNGVVRLLQGEASDEEIAYYAHGSFFNLEELDERLEFYGLTGVQLEMKLASFYDTYNQVMQPPTFENVTTGNYDQQKHPGAKKKQSRFMRWLLPKINSILGSLSRAVPGVDIIKEFKEMSEFGYEESQTDGLPF